MFDSPVSILFFNSPLAYSFCASVTSLLEIILLYVDSINELYASMYLSIVNAPSINLVSNISDSLLYFSLSISIPLTSGFFAPSFAMPEYLLFDKSSFEYSENFSFDFFFISSIYLFFSITVFISRLLNLLLIFSFSV